VNGTCKGDKHYNQFHSRLDQRNSALLCWQKIVTRLLAVKVAIFFATTIVRYFLFYLYEVRPRTYYAYPIKVRLDDRFLPLASPRSEGMHYLVSFDLYVRDLVSRPATQTCKHNNMIV
jgi:hypothetical protein